MLWHCLHFMQCPLVANSNAYRSIHKYQGTHRHSTFDTRLCTCKLQSKSFQRSVLLFGVKTITKTISDPPSASGRRRLDGRDLIQTHRQLRSNIYKFQDMSCPIGRQVGVSVILGRCQRLIKVLDHFKGQSYTDSCKFVNKHRAVSKLISTVDSVIVVEHL